MRFSIPLCAYIRPTKRTSDSSSRIPWSWRTGPPSFPGWNRCTSTGFAITTGVYRHTARLVAAYVLVDITIRSARRVVEYPRVERYKDSTIGPKIDGTSMSQWSVTTNGRPGGRLALPAGDGGG